MMESFSHLMSEASYPAPKEYKSFDLRKGDVAILEQLAENPRISLVELSNVVDLDRQTVRKRIERLVKNNVILNMGAVIDASKLDYINISLSFPLKTGHPGERSCRGFFPVSRVFITQVLQ